MNAPEASLFKNNGGEQAALMKKSLLDDLQRLVGCEYLSDMRLKERYNRKARFLLYRMNIDKYPLAQRLDAIEYLNENNKDSITATKYLYIE